MAYTLSKDIDFLKGVTKELIERVISTEIILYKISTRNSAVNIYGEMDNKVYETPVRLFAMIRSESKQGSAEEHVITYGKDIKVSFAKQELIDKDVVIEVGDIIYYDNKHFEIGLVSNSKYWSGRNPETAVGVELNLGNPSGYNYSVEAFAHLTNASGLK